MKRALCLYLLVVFFSFAPLVWGEEESTESPLTQQQLKLLDKARHLAAEGKGPKGNEMIEAMLSEAETVSQCLAIASATDKTGFGLQEARRKALDKAFTFSKSWDDDFLIALKAHQLECYDISAQAMKQLVANATSRQQLFQIAQKAQEISLSDLSRMALDKIYEESKTVPEAIEVAKYARLDGANDLARKIVKELIDDQQTAAELCDLVASVKDFEYTDANRYLLKRALGLAQTVEDYLQIHRVAQELHQPDIVDIAAFRYKKLQLIQQLQQEQVTKQQMIDVQQQKALEIKQRVDAAKEPGF